MKRPSRTRCVERTEIDSGAIAYLSLEELAASLYVEGLPKVQVLDYFNQEGWFEAYRCIYRLLPEQIQGEKP